MAQAVQRTEAHNINNGIYKLKHWELLQRIITALTIHRVKWRHGVYGNDTIDICG